MKRLLPKLDWITVHRNQAAYRLPYCFRKGNGGPALLFVHGLGGCKENFYAAFQSAALADCDLLHSIFPGLASQNSMPPRVPTSVRWRRIDTPRLEGAPSRTSVSRRCQHGRLGWSSDDAKIRQRGS